MHKKEDIGVGIIGIFLLVSLALIVFMMPFDPPTTYAVLDENSTLAALSDNVLLVIVVLIIVATSVAAAFMLIRQKRKRDMILKKIPSDKLKNVEDYIMSTIAKGFSKQDIHKALVHSGWDDTTAEALIRHFMPF